MKNKYFFSQTNYAGFYTHYSKLPACEQPHTHKKIPKINTFFKKLSITLGIFTLILLYNYSAFSQCSGLNVGDTYGGGIVAYILQSGDPGYEAGKCKGLIATPSDQGTSVYWGCPANLLGVTSTALGSGAANTTAVISNCPTQGIAVHICDTLTLNGYTDWYLPSRDELSKLYLNKTAIGGFTSNSYWTSSEYDSNSAWRVWFTDGTTDEIAKGNAVYVRAIRSFEVEAPVITSQPNASSMCLSGSTNVSITATGSSLSYQWQYYNGISWSNVANGSPAGTAYTGGNATTLGIAGTSTAGTYPYRCYVSNLGGNITSNTANLTVYPDMTSGSVGANQTICYNTSPTGFTNLSLPTGGSGTYSYQWQSQPGCTGGWTNISGANATTYQAANLTQTTCYRRNVNDLCAVGNSNTITITVYGQLNAGSIGTAQTICQGAAPNAITSVMPPSGGTGSYTYQWQSSLDCSGAYADISGATSNTYQPPALSQTICLRRQVTSGSCGTTNTSEIEMTVVPLPLATITGTTTVCQFAAQPDVTFSNPQALPIKITYNVNGGANQTINVNASGTANASVSTSSLGSFNYNLVSAEYQDIPTCPNNLTDYVTITVAPTVGTPTEPTPSSTSVCQGSANTFYSTSATDATSYNWTVSGAGNSISGTGSTAEVAWSLGFSGVATISVTANGCNGPSASASTTVTVKPTPTASISGTNTVCQNATEPEVLFTNPQGLPVTVTYNINGGSNETVNIDASTFNVVLAPTSVADTFVYNLVSVAYQVYPFCMNNITGSATVIISPIPATPGTITGMLTQAPGATAQTYSIADISGVTSYTWTVPTGWTITGGQGDTLILVTTGGVGDDGDITVTATNTCGTSSAAVLPVTVAGAWSCGTPLSIQHTSGSVAPETKIVNYGTVETSLSGATKCWITSNLGASQQATAANDATESSAGWYWQFNRKQGYKNAGSVTPAWTITDIDEASNWTIDQDPCNALLGSGWRIPTYTEWSTADGSWSNSSDAYSSVLKLHTAGYLDRYTGAANERGTMGKYWSSSQGSSAQGHFLDMGSSWSLMTNDYKAHGYTLRCIKDDCSLPATPTTLSPSISHNQIIWRWNSTPGATGYKYNTTNDYSSATDAGTDTTYTQTSLTPSTPYTLYVWSYNACGNSTTPLTLSANTIADPCNGTSSVSDNDGNTYNVVAIGTQCWFAKNLATTKYRTGNAIEYPGTDTTAWANDTTGAYAWYNNDLGNKATYGALYNGYAATNGFKLCPQGWKVPSLAEWTTLTTYLGGESVAGGKLKETGTTHWNSPNTGATNETGFTALPGGQRTYTSGFSNIGVFAYYWSSIRYSPDAVYCAYLINDTNKIITVGREINYGHSVRCLKDNSTFSNLNITGNLEICSGGSTTLTAEPGATCTYLWSNSATTDSIIVSPTVTTTYTVTVTNGIDTDSISVVVKVSPLTTLSLVSTPGSDVQAVCFGNAIQDIVYSYTNATGISFSGLPTGVTGNTTTATISGTPSATGFYTYTVTPTGGCGNVEATGTIKVATTPSTPSSIGGNTATYPNIAQNYMVNPVSGAEYYIWTVPNGWSIIAGDSSNAITVSTGNAGQNGNITVYAANPCGISSTQSIAVTVNTPCPIISSFPHTQNFDGFNPNVNDQSNNTYNSVSIGKQVWFQQNLKTTKFRDGSDILNLPVDSVWANHTAPAYCWYNNDFSTNGTLYGALYNFYTVQTGKLCPTNWHVPSNDEWTEVSTFLGGNSLAGGKLKEAGISHWNSPNIGATNETGFNALPSGLRNNSGSFISISTTNAWWNSSASTYDPKLNAWYSTLTSVNDDIVHDDMATKGFGFSVRCVRDLPNCWVNEPGWQFGTFANGPAGSTGKYAYFDSETYTANGASALDASLITPPFSFTGQTAPRVSFKHFFQKINAETATFSYSTDGGNTWTQVQQWTASTANPESFVQTISALANEAQVSFKWTYTGTGKYWSIDDFQIDFCDVTGGAIGASQTICNNTTPAAFTSIQTPTGGVGGYTYQWQKQPDCIGGWTNLTGATASTYQHGATVTQKICFRRMVTSGTCTAYTDIITVDVLPDNVITLTSGLGTDTVLICKDATMLPITYTTTGATSANITNLPTGVTGNWNSGEPTITGNPSVAGTYNYNILLTGGCGTVSANGVITVIDVPNTPGTINGLTEQPALASGIVYYIDSVPGATSYTWTVPAGWSIDAGQGTVSIDVTTGTQGSNGNITVTATNSCGTSAANTLAVEVLPTCQVTTQPVNVSICSGGNTSFTIGVAVAGSYQWQESTDGGNTWSDLSNGGVYSNVNMLTLNITSVTSSMDGYMYQCVVNGACGLEVISNAATLTVNTPPDILWQPLSTSTCINGVVTFTVDATGGSLSYQWQENTGSGWSNLSNNSPYSNVTTSALTISPATSGMDSYQYRVFITGVCTPYTITSLAATLTIGSYNAITLSSAPGTDNQETCYNEAIVTITYDVVGATSASYTGLPTGVTGNLVSNTILISGSPTATGVFNYTINLVGGCGVATESGTITVKSLPNKPFIQTAINNQETSFTAKWNASAGGADGYYLDVSSNSSFTAILPGYDNLDVGNVTTYNVTGLTCNTTYFYRVRAIKNGCFSDYSYTMSAPTIACSCPNVGESYDGGIVAYILQSGDPGYVQGQCAAIIAAAADMPAAAWGCEGTAIGTADNIGDGYNNNSAILIGCATPLIAAEVCEDLILNSYEDWFLPSKAELEKLYINRLAIGGFGSSQYWSSSEVDEDLAYTLDFSNGQFASAGKNTLKTVRPVRYLLPPVTQLVTDTVCYQDSIIYKIPPVPGATHYTWEFTGPYDELNEMGTMCNLIPLNDGVLSVTAHNECGPSTTRVLEVIVYHYGALEWNGINDNNWFNAENWNPPVSSKSTLNCPIRIPGPSTYVQLETDAPHQPVIDFALAGTDIAECQSILIRDDDILTLKNDAMSEMNTLEVNGHLGLSGSIIFENDSNRILLKSDTGQIQFNVSALKATGDLCRTCIFVLEDESKYEITESDAEAKKITLEGNSELVLTEDLQLHVYNLELTNALSTLTLENNTTLNIAGEFTNVGTLDLTNGTVYYNNGIDIWLADSGYKSQTIIPATYSTLKANGGNYSDGKTLTIGSGSDDVICNSLELLNMGYPTKVQTNINSDIIFTDGGTFSFAADPDSSYMILDINSRFNAPDLNTEFVMGDMDPDYNNNVINIYYSDPALKAIKLKADPLEFFGTVNYKGSGKQIVVDNTYKNLVLDAHEECVIEIHEDDDDLFVNEYLNLKSGQLNLNTNKLTITTYNNFAIAYNIGHIYAETTPVTSFDNLVQWNIGGSVQSSGKTYTVPFGEDWQTILPYSFDVVENDMTEIDGYVQFSTYKTTQPNLPYPVAIPHLGEYDNGGGVYDRYWYFNYYIDEDDKVSHAGSPVEGTLSFSFINDLTNLDGILVGDMIAQRFNAHDEVWADVLYTQNLTTAMPVYGGSTITDVTPGGEIKAFNTSYIDETQFYNIWVLSSTESILPITLLDFTAECQSDKIELRWATATETNADYFTVERSKDGVTWVEVGQVQAAGTSSVQHNYTLTDNYPLDGLAYYRLSQTDFNGTSKVAKTIVSNCVIDKPAALSIYPNPFNESIQINFVNVNGDNAEFAIFDALGKLVINKEITKVELEQGYIILDLKNLANAIYYVRFTTEEVTLFEKVMKQK